MTIAAATADRALAAPSRIPIAIDATMMLEGMPVALLEASGRPLIIHHFEIVRSADAASATTVYVPKGFADTIRTIIAGVGLSAIAVSTEVPPDDALTIKASDFYVAHALSRVLRRRRGDLSRAFICSVQKASDLSKVEAFVWRQQKLVFSRRLNMPVARAIALRLRHTNITPDQVTIGSCLVGLAAAYLISTGRYPLELAGALLLQLALTLDLSDGYLARLTDRSTRFGNWLDTVVDEVNSIAVIAGVLIAVIRQDGFGFWAACGMLWLLCFHVISANYWLSRAYQLPEAAEGVQRLVGPNTVLARLAGVARRVLAVSQGLDSKFHVVTVGLALNQKPALVVFMGLANLTSLAVVITSRFASRAQLQ